MKRSISLLLVLFMTFSILCACKQGDENDGDDTSISTTTAEKEKPYLDDLPEDLKFDGREVNIFYGEYDPNFNCKKYELEGAKEGTDNIAIAVYERNAEVQSRLDVSLKFTQIDNSSEAAEYTAKIENAIINSASTEFDLVYHRAQNAVVHSTRGYFRSVNDLPYVDWDKDYWFYEQMENVSLNASQIQIILGDLLVSNYANMTAIFFNRDLYDVENGENSSLSLYKLVKENKWTWEEYFKIVADAYKDNGDGKPTADDIYGAHWENGTRTCQYYPYSSGVKFTSRDSEGFPVLELTSDRVGEMVEDLYGFIHENEGTIELSYDAAAEKFFGGEMLFYSYFLSRGTTVSKSVNFNYGILPFPKYDENAEYTSTLLTGAGVYVIPNTIDSEDRINCLGATLEALCSASSKNVVPEYWDVLLKVRMADSEENSEMISIIRDSLKFDVTFWMGDSIGRVSRTFYQAIIKDGTKSYPSTYSVYGSNYETELSNLIASYSK